MSGSPRRIDRLAALLIGLLALAHGLAYAMLLPLWQAPDEPTLFEYVALTAQLGRIPAPSEGDPALEAAILASLGRNNFWAYTRGAAPTPPPKSLAEVGAWFSMPRQVGGDPPLYFALAGLALRPALSWPIEAQARLLRLLNVLLLPLAALCAYGAARTLDGGRWTVDGVSSATNLVFIEPPSTVHCPPSTISIAAGLFVALHPMFAASAAQVGNDGLANLIGAALCWTLLAQVGRRVTRKGALMILGLLVLGLLTKRTLAPFAAVIIGGLLISGLGRLRQQRAGQLVSGLSRLSGGRLQIFLHPLNPLNPLTIAAIVLILMQLDWRGAAGWLDATSLRPAQRTSGAEPSLVLNAGDEAVQALPAIGVAALQADALRFGARVRGSDASGQLVLYVGDQRQATLPFTVDGVEQLAESAYLQRGAPDLRLGIVAERGTIYVDRLWLRGGRLPGNQLANGDLAWPAIAPGTPLAQAASYLRLGELAWAARSGYIFRAPPLKDSGWWATLFESFWGRFGWLNVPLVAGTAWAPLLAAVSLGGLGGLLVQTVDGRRRTGDGASQKMGRVDDETPSPVYRLLSTPTTVHRPPSGPAIRRRQAVTLIGIVAAALLAVMLNSLAAADGAPQGRYLFPTMAAWSLVLTWGLLNWISPRYQTTGLLSWVGLWGIFAGTTLWRLAIHYYR